jgi:hypothetical protein
MIEMNRIKQAHNREIRRCLLQVLYEAGSALRAKSVRSIMSDLGTSVFWSEFLDHVEYLAGEELVRVFPAGARQELSDVEQAQFIADCKRLRFDAPECETVMLRIRQKGRHFIEGNDHGVKGL